ncbi:speedy protein 1-B-like [Eleutherodactylus coqui]|uniref:speedy protein 1-B-like n=1 Tax=Eleutherodactylus coqui TaxID=57060 RepID=UPI0034617CB2
MKISDKYLLAMVLVYFRRAGLRTEEYRKNFFPALFLANQMEEELPFRWQIYPWALGDNWMENTEVLFQQRNQLLLRMGFRAWVDRTTCDLVMAEAPSHWAWTRERQSDHSLAIPIFRMDEEDFIISHKRFQHPYCLLCKTLRRYPTLRKFCQAKEDPDNNLD